MIYQQRKSSHSQETTQKIVPSFSASVQKPKIVPSFSQNKPGKIVPSFQKPKPKVVPSFQPKPKGVPNFQQPQKSKQTSQPFSEMVPKFQSTPRRNIPTPSSTFTPASLIPNR